MSTEEGQKSVNLSRIPFKLSSCTQGHNQTQKQILIKYSPFFLMGCVFHLPLKSLLELLIGPMWRFHSESLWSASKEVACLILQLFLTVPHVQV